MNHMQLYLLAASGNPWGGGVRWNQTSDTYSRTGALMNEATSASPGNGKLPVHRLMRRCLLLDTGVVNYYTHPDDGTVKASGAVADLSGADGQVMLQVPALWVKYKWTDPEHWWEIYNRPKAGAILHPAFYKAGIPVPYRYYSAYEGSMFDASEGAMTDSALIHTDMYAAGDKLCSISGQYPKTNERRSEYRAMAAQRGSGWHQQDFYLMSAIQLLYLIEYANFNSQAMIGAGRTNLSGGGWTAGSYIGITGLSNSLGNRTGAVQHGGTNGHATDFMSYRGIENWWGNVWKFVDGFSVYNDSSVGSQAWVTGNSSHFADNTDANYTLLTSALAQADGWARQIAPVETGFLPSSVAGGSNNSGLADYHYTYYDDNADVGWRVALWGGGANHGALAGAFSLYSSLGSTFALTHLGGRLCF